MDQVPVDLCLHFANTVDWHASAHPHERLATFTDVVAWAEQRNLVSLADAQRLRAAARAHPQHARATLAQAIVLREAIYRIVLARLHDEPPAPDDMQALNGAIGEAFGQLQLVATQECFTWTWATHERPLSWVLWPVARSAADLLTSPLLERVGQCADDRGCGWLFLDLSKNRSRRWCDINDCGNRAKARRHYQRTRQATSMTSADERDARQDR